MKNKCIHCGVPFHIFEEGFLFIYTDLPLSISFNSFSKNWWAGSYNSIEELKNILLKWKQEYGELFGHIKGGLCNQNVRPLVTYPLSELLSRVVNRDIIHTIQEGELQSYIQPIIQLQKNDQLYGFESLLRTKGDNQVSPGKLFYIAEETGMLSLLDQRARETAIQARKSFIKPGLKSFINFLPSTIYNPEFCLRHTFQLVKKYNIDPSDLVFEVVETEKIEDVDHLKKILSTYKREGMKVALDDVGAGFSTLETLELLQPDYVKIDRYYIDYCDQSTEKQSFLSKVIKLARELNIIVLAEGIERKSELEYCRSIGIDLAQGYFIGKPSLNGGIKNEIC